MPGATTELFLDDALVSCKQDVIEVLHEPVRHPEPVLVADQPWEGFGVALAGTVMFDQDRFRMWYMALPEKARGAQFMAYAESDDGIAWRKPMLEVIPFGEHARTNLVMGQGVNIHGPCVIRNPDASEEREKYLVFFDSYSKYRPESAQVQSQSRWSYTAASADGFHWVPPKGRAAVPGKSDTGQSVVWDPATRQFLAYMRGVMSDHNGQRIRYVRLATSADFVHWSAPIELMRSDEADGGADHQFHQFSVTRYGSVYIGLLSVFHIRDLATENGRPCYTSRPYPEIASCDTHLAVSRDGIRWQRVANRQPFLGLRPGMWDGMFINTASQMVLRDDQVWIYYAGNRNMQGMGYAKAIGAARLPRDRFLALEPRTRLDTGVVETTPLRLEDGALSINANADGGCVRVELCTFNGGKIEGFGKDECTPLSADKLSHTVAWRHAGRTRGLGDALRETSGNPIRIRFYLNQARLYAYEARSSPP